MFFTGAGWAFGISSEQGVKLDWVHLLDQLLNLPIVVTIVRVIVACPLLSSVLPNEESNVLRKLCLSSVL